MTMEDVERRQARRLERDDKILAAKNHEVFLMLLGNFGREAVCLMLDYVSVALSDVDDEAVWDKFGELDDRYGEDESYARAIWDNRPDIVQIISDGLGYPAHEWMEGHFLKMAEAVRLAKTTAWGARVDGHPPDRYFIPPENFESIVREVTRKYRVMRSIVKHYRSKLRAETASKTKPSHIEPSEKRVSAAAERATVLRAVLLTSHFDCHGALTDSNPLSLAQIKKTVAGFSRSRKGWSDPNITRALQQVFHYGGHAQYSRMLANQPEKLCEMLQDEPLGWHPLSDGNEVVSGIAG